MHLKTLFFTFFIGILLLNAHEGGEENNSRHTFIINKGQWPEQVVYKAEVASGTSVYFEKNAIHYQFISNPYSHPKQAPDENALIQGHVFKAVYLGSNQEVTHHEYDAADYYYNYFLGNDRSKWKGNVGVYNKIQYQNLYKGIDLISYRKNGFLKYDYHIESGANPDQIQIQYIGVETPVVQDGELLIKHHVGQMIEESPIAYQFDETGEKAFIKCNYFINEEGILSFIFPEGYDENYELIIDPKLVFSTYSGSLADNFGMTGTFDNDGSGYMGGTVYEDRYNATPGAFDRSFNNGTIDISISKFNSDGSELEFATYLGGNRNETVHSLIVNSASELYLLGVTASADYPTSSGAFDTTLESTAFSRTEIIGYSGGADIVVSRFSKDGSQLLSSTFYGGSGVDGINGVGTINYTGTNFNYGDSHRGEIVLDSLGYCYIGTVTRSTSLDSTLNSHTGSQEGLIVKFSPNLDSVIWARYHGGSNRDAIYSIKILDSNKLVVGGGTMSTDGSFPITNGSYKTTHGGGGDADGFISIISADGSSVEHSTFIGTGVYDQVYFVESDRDGKIYALGQTESNGFTIVNSNIANSGTGQFIVKLNSSLSTLEISHPFGNGSIINISPTAFLVDRCNNIFASGWGGGIIVPTPNNPLGPFEGTKVLTNNMPLTPDSSYSNTTDGNDFYLYVVGQNLDTTNLTVVIDTLLYGSYFGGTASDDHVDGGTSRFDKDGIIYQSVCASCGTPTTDFPTDSGLFKVDNSRRPNDTTSSGCNNALFKLDFQILPRADFDVTQKEFCLNEAENDTISITVTDKSVRSESTSWNFNGTIITNATFRDTTIFITKPGLYTIRQDIQNIACAQGDFDTLVINVRPDNIELLAFDDTTICFEDSTQLTVFSNSKANTFIWSRNADLSNPLPENDSSITVHLNSGKNLFYVQAGNSITNACEKMDTLEVNYFPSIFSASISADTVCENSPVTVNATMQNIDRFLWDFGNGEFDSTSLQKEVDYTSSGDYTIQLELENNNCAVNNLVTFDLHVKANDLGFSNLSDTLVCGMNGLRVIKPSVGDIEKYVWSSNRNFTDTLNSSTQDSSFLLSQTDSAQFFLKISNRFCERIDSLNAEYIEYDLRLEGLIDEACSPFTTELQTTIIGADSFRIFFGNGMSTNTDSTPIINFPDPGIFNIQLVGGNQKCGINQTFTETIEILQGVEIETLMDTTICFGDTVTLSANTFGTGVDFFWDTLANFSTPINNPVDSGIRVSPGDSTTYFFRAVNGICNGEDALDLNIDQVVVDLNDETLCLGDTLDLVAEIINASSSLNYTWEPNDSILSGQNTDRIVLSPKVDLQITLSSTNSIGCIDNDTMLIDVRIPDFDSAIIFTSTDTAYKTQIVRLSTNRNGANLVYFWEPIDDLDNPNSPQPNLTASETDTFKVTITDINTTCTIEAFRRLVVFEINCEEPNIFIPTAFTPNNDQANDVLFVRGTHLESIEFQLFNRWGEKVFETKEKEKGWDGYYNGRSVDPGVFVYHLRAICLDGQRYFKKGNITLLR